MASEVINRGGAILFIKSFSASDENAPNGVRSAFEREPAESEGLLTKE